MEEGKFSPRAYVKKEGLLQITSEGMVRDVCKKVILGNKKAVEDYYSGNEKSFHFLVGQVMRETKGKAEPGLVNRIMKEVVDEGRRK